uniref:Uncharacterized protein n=1 Tax=viral metagenome TaxID=1070528 RepID=A0A6M3X651_9ZZZZ
MKKLKFEDMEGKMNDDRNIAFVKIKDKENAQQVTINLKQLTQIGRLSAILEKLGFDTVTITVENNNPLLIGKKDIGIAISAIEEES